MKDRAMRKLLALFPVLVLPACATIMEGTSQSVLVVTEPAGQLHR
jgi:hypothetical protein